MLDVTLERATEIFWDTLEVYRPAREKTSVFLAALAAIMVCLIYSAFFLNIDPVELEKHSDVNNIKSSAGCQFTNVCPSKLWCLREDWWQLQRASQCEHRTTIKLGRKPALKILEDIPLPFYQWAIDLPMPVFHWAIKVGNIWYEIVGKGTEGAEKGIKNDIDMSEGYAAASTAGKFGGQIVGETSKSCEEVLFYTEEWLRKYETYHVLAENCQKFAYEFTSFLTDGINFRLPNNFDAASIEDDNCERFLERITAWDYFFIEQPDGIAIVRVGTQECRLSKWNIHALARGPSIEGGWAWGRPGVGFWLAPTAGRLQLNLGPLLGFHIEPSFNTGVGLRDGLLNVHFLGWGVRLGFDTVEFNLFFLPCCGFSMSPLVFLCLYVGFLGIHHEGLP